MNESTQISEIKRKRCTVYIDGFNWYHAIFEKNPQWKWLNIQSLFEEIRNSEDVTEITFFTARLSHERLTNNRQGIYLEALRSTPKVKMKLGSFRKRERVCKSDCGKTYQGYEEKKTDVNIAISMLLDAFDGKTESIVLVSGDSDQEPAMLELKRRFPKIDLTVYIPSLPEDEEKRRNLVYGQNNINCRLLPLNFMDKHQFPQKVPWKNGLFVERPLSWK